MALYMNGQEISQSSGVPIAVEGLTAVNEGTSSNIQGLVKGNGSTLQVAMAGTDYATVEQAKTFVVTFTLGENQTVTADKTVQEIITAHEAGQMVLGFLADDGLVLQLSQIMAYPTPDEGYSLVVFSLSFNGTMFWLAGQSGAWSLQLHDLAAPPASATALPDSGTALTANTIYAVADAVGTYAFTPPSRGGWAHGYFATGASVDISFSGNFLGAAPIIAANKAYEFDVCESIWAVQEIVSA